MENNYESLANKEYPYPKEWINDLESTIDRERQAFINGLSRCKVLVDAGDELCAGGIEMMPPITKLKHGLISRLIKFKSVLATFPDKVDEPTKPFYCQNDIEKDIICEKQCDHCKIYYKPVEFPESVDEDGWRELVKAQDDYIEFLDTESKLFVGFAFVHGMKVNERVSEKGQEHRENISLLKSKLFSPPKTLNNGK